VIFVAIIEIEIILFLSYLQDIQKTLQKTPNMAHVADQKPNLLHTQLALHITIRPSDPYSVICYIPDLRVRRKPFRRGVDGRQSRSLLRRHPQGVGHDRRRRRSGARGSFIYVDCAVYRNGASPLFSNSMLAFAQFLATVFGNS
jgi:hypothetical protein